MNAEIARQVVQQYIDGWKANSVEKITMSLTEDCVVLESHGPTYRGVEQIRQWMEFWLKEGVA